METPILLVLLAISLVALVSVSSANNLLRNELMQKERSFHIEKLQLLSKLTLFTAINVNGSGDVTLLKKIDTPALEDDELFNKN